MDSSGLLALVSFVIVTTFTPGPNNLIVASLGIQQGLRRTMPAIYGVTVGFVFLMISCGLFAGIVLEILPEVETWIRWAGGCYILWLAYKTMTSGFSMDANNTAIVGGFWAMAGFQFLNPKAVTFGMTVFSAFMTDYLDQPGTVLLTAGGLASSAFASTLAWAAFGSLFKRRLQDESVRRRVRIVVGLLLLYVAIDLVWV